MGGSLRWRPCLTVRPFTPEQAITEPHNPHHSHDNRRGFHETHDPNQARMKLAEPSVCGDSGVV